jgi:DNA-binding MurR/RpiR family transcriptional regulator
VLTITSHEHSRLAKLADFNLSWHVPQTRIAGFMILRRKFR